MSELGAGGGEGEIARAARSFGPTRRRLYELLEAGQGGDFASRAVDAGLMALILTNVACATLESIPTLQARFGEVFLAFELFSVAVFTLEYVARIYCAVESDNPRYQHPLWGRLRYAVSPMALIDLLAIAPFYVAAGTGLDLRIVRTLRLLRILKLAHYFSALGVLLDVIRTERAAFGAAYFLIALGITLASSGIYITEHQAQPEAFGSVPAALYWAIVTLTTVGYGDVVPVTPAGRVLGVIVMMLGVGTLAIPTGILATGFTLELRRRRHHAEAVAAEFALDSCPNCGFQLDADTPEDSSPPRST